MEINKSKLQKVITVTGEGNTGKTTLIKFVYDTLRQSGAIVLFYEQVGAFFEDFHTVLVCNCKIIAICSIGDEADKKEKDPWKYIKEGIDLAINHNADYLINALSIPIPDNNDAQNTINEYKDILGQNFPSDSYTPINLEYIKPGDYKPLQERQSNCKKILNIISKEE